MVRLFEAAENTISDFETPTFDFNNRLQVRTSRFDPHEQHQPRTVATDSGLATRF